jgi:hypothetical protein
LQAPDGLTVDHISGDLLDNRRANLRLCTLAENQRNSAKQRRARASRYKGVHRGKGPRPWVAQIGARPRCHIGCFATEEEAGRAYDAEARRRWGEYARLNFPMEGR